MDDGISFWQFFVLLFIFVPMAIVWFRTVVDIFDRRDLNGAAKVLWLVGVLVVPLIGTLAYLFTRPVTEQDRERAAALDEALHQARSDQRRGAGFSVADELEKLEALRQSGSLSQDEFDLQRARVLD